MAMRPKLMCRHLGCRNTIDNPGYCQTHAPLHSGWVRDRSRGTESSSKRGYGAFWQKLRLAVLERDDYLCVQCKAEGRVAPATDVDHILPKSYGGKDEMGNLQSLCKPCHKIKTAEEARVGYRTFRRSQK